MSGELIIALGVGIIVFSTILFIVVQIFMYRRSK